ncbi:MAG: radical SAM protein [Candidatus Obscuribacterales bacterium]|jgi:MoaA/NifB/PqqE/SkfB family radical SAM enzyme|nr:radical SAM protein [Candidatus Obscuribacterales bacterium]
MQATEQSATARKDCINVLDLLWLEITPKCNLNCVHCYADSSPYKPLSSGLSIDDWLALINEASVLNCRMIQFIGGEPTIHPDLPKLISAARAAGIPSIEVYTNGTCFTSALQECFLENNVQLAFSVYADDPAIHDLVTRTDGSQQKTLAAIEWAMKNSMTVRAGVIDAGINKSHTEAAVQLLKSKGLKNVGIDRSRNIGRTQVSSDPAELLRELCGKCAPKKLCVTSAGDIYPCVFSRFYVIGNAADGLGAALHSSQLRTFEEALHSCQRALAGENTDDADFNACNPDRPSPCRPDEICNPDTTCRPDADCQPKHCNPERTGEN